MSIKKKDSSGKVYDKMDRLCVILLAVDNDIPRKYRYPLWNPMRSYIDKAQACAEMAFLEIDIHEKVALANDARKYFRMFKRYYRRCEMTGEFRFGHTLEIDIEELIVQIEGELNRWFAKLKRMLVSSGAVAASPEHPE